MLVNITEQNRLFSKFLRPVAIFLFFMSLQRGFYEVVSGLNAQHPIDFSQHALIYFTGFRFDLMVWSFTILPLFGLIFFKIKFSLKILISKIYLSLGWLAVSVLNFLNLPYFALEQKHLNRPEWDSFNFMETLTQWLQGEGFYLKGTVLIFILLTAVLGVIELVQVESRDSALLNLGKRRSKVLLQFLFILIAVVFCARGNLSPHHLRREDSVFQAHPGWNELVLNAQWSFDKDDR